MKDLIHEILNNHLVVVFTRYGSKKVIKQEDFGKIAAELEKAISQEVK